MNIATRSLALACLLGLFSLGAQAQADKPSKERELLRRAQQELRRVQQENADLLRDKQKLEGELKVAADEAGRADAARARGAALEAQVERLRRDAGEQGNRQASAEAELRTLEAQKAEAQKQITARDAEVAQLSAQLERTRAVQGACEVKNVQLFEYSQALLQRYRDKGVMDALAQREPVFGFKDVEIENTVEEYRDKLAAQRVPASVTPAVE